MTRYFSYFPGTFFQPFLNGFNQFTTRFNPFGRPLQSQPVFQQFPSQASQSQLFRPQPQATVAPQPTFQNNFQTVRFPQQTQFGSPPTSQQQQFASFPQQPQPQQPQVQPQPQQPQVRPPFTAFNQQSQFNRPQQPQEVITTPFTPLQASQRPQAPAEPQQPPRPQFEQPQVFTSQQQRFPPDASVSSSFGISSGTGSQSTSDFTQSFRPDNPEPGPSGFEPEEQIRSSGGASQSAIDNTFASFPGRVPLRPQFPTEQTTTTTTDDGFNGARVRIRPVGTIGNTDPTRLQQPQEQPEVTSPRARQPLVTTREPLRSNEGDEDLRGPTGVRVVRVRPTKRPFRTENFTPIEFIPGSDEVTPPPVISRVRGRPIVPDDFPGSQLAIRGKTPEDESPEVPTGPGVDDRGRIPPTGPTGPSGTRTRTRVRIVPTGNRARRPIQNEPEPVEQPRASSNQGRPLNNRLPFSALDTERPTEEPEPTGFPRRRLRPVTRVTPSGPPTRTLRPFTTEETTQPSTISLVPTAPSVTRTRAQDLLRQTLVQNAELISTEKPTESSSKTSGDDHFDPNHLLAHVQAVKAAEESDQTEEVRKTKTTTQKALDDSEESNFIPLSAVPTDTSQQTDDITVINLQKDTKSKQTFQGFVDSDSIDDSIRSPVPFIPTRPTPVSTSTTTTTPKPTTVTTTPFRPTSRPAFASTTSPFVRVPFGPFNPQPQPSTTTEKDKPKVSVSVSTSLSKSSTSSSESTSSVNTEQVNINDELDRLQSSLDPWARIQQQLKEKEEILTEEPPTETTTTSTRLSLFKIRTLPPRTTRTTTTFKPRSLADLFKHRDGLKITEQGGTTEQTTLPPTTEVTTTTTSQRPTPKSIINRFRPSTKEATTTSTTTSRPKLGGFKPRGKEQTVRDLLASIPKDDIGGLLPRDFSNSNKRPSETKPSRPTFKRPSNLPSRRPTPSNIKTDDVSKFLPPGFNLESTTTTTTDTSLIADILSSIEQEDISKFLPNDFKSDSSSNSRPKPPRLFKPADTTTTTTTKETTEKSKSNNLFDSVNFDDVSAFLPPGFKPEETETTSTTNKPDFKLDISSLFDDIKTEDVSSLLPPGFNPEGPPPKTEDNETEKTTEKIVLKFPTRPGGIKKTESSTKGQRREGPKLDIPQIKSDLWDR